MWEQLFLLTPGVLLMIFRVAGMIFSLSFMGKDAESRWPRMVLSVSLGVILFFVDPVPVGLPPSFIMLAVMAVREVLVGLLVGICLSTAFHAVRMAGEFIGREMGLSLARLMDPAIGSGGVVMSSLFEMLAVLLFFHLDGHRLLFVLLARFNRVLPLGGGFDPAAAYEGMVWFGSWMMESSIIVAAPVFTIMLVLTMTMMILGRAVPQLPIMQFGFGIRICVGMYASILFVGRSMPRFKQMFDDVGMRLWQMAGELSPL